MQLFLLKADIIEFYEEHSFFFCLVSGFECWGALGQPQSEAVIVVA